MAIDIVEQKTETVGMIAAPEAASQSRLGDRCASPYAPSTLRPAVDPDPVETKEWVDAFRGTLETDGVDRARFLIEQLRYLARLDRPPRVECLPKGPHRRQLRPLVDLRGG